MYGYIPENVYNKIKDTDEYKAMGSMIDDGKAVDNFEDAFYRDHELQTKDNRAEAYKKTIIELTAKYCPEFNLPVLLILNWNLPKSDLLNLYKEKDKYNDESVLYLISYIASRSYEDHTQDDWAAIYKETYEKVIDKKSLSAYCHENYILKASSHFAQETRMSGNFLEENMANLKTIRDSVLTIIPEDSADMIKHNYLESVRYIIDVLMANHDGVDAAKQISDYRINHLFDVKFQYQTISYAIMDIYDKCYDVLFGVRDLTQAMYLMEHLFKYVDYAMRDKEKFFRGLEYYDKINQYGTLCIIRKMLRISTFLPGLGFKLKNLSEKDEAFIMQQKYDLDRFPSETVQLIFSRHLKKSDDLISGNIQTYALLKDNEFDKSIRAELDK